MSGHQAALMDGAARLLAQAGAGTYRPDGEAYEPGEVAITLGLLPAHPAEAIAVTAYTVEDDPTQPTGITGLQVRLRGAGHDPRPVFTRADAVFGALHGAYKLRLPGPDGLVVGQCWRQMSAPLGTDEQGRYELADSYYCRIDRPTTHRP